MTTISVIYHSPGGHTEKQAEAITRGAAGVPGVIVHFLRIEASQIAAGGRWRDKEILDTLTVSDGIIFGSVTYFGCVSAPFKAFLDATFDLWSVQAWKNKFAGGFTNSASMNGDKQMTLVTLLIYAAQMGMIWVPMGDHPGGHWTGAPADDINRLGSFLGAMMQSQADLTADETSPAGDLRTAQRYGQHFAAVVRHWLREGDYIPERVLDPAVAALAARRQAAKTHRP